MALTMWGQLIIQAATPEEDPVKVGTLWVDISGTATLKVCTAISPYTWVEISGSGGTPDAHATSHQDGGSDEINVTGLTGLLATAQTPAAHATSHQDGGSDEISVTGLTGLLATAQTPAAHKTSHENGGSDELSLVGLNGLLADRQTALAGSATPVEQTSSTSGTNNNFSLTGEYTLLRYTSGSSATFTGFTVGGVQPTTNAVVIVECVGAATITFAHQNSSSTAGHRIITPTTTSLILNPSGLADGGKAIAIYDVTTSRWRVSILDKETTEQTTTSTGTQANFDLTPIGGDTVHLRCNNASALTISGFLVGGAGPSRKRTVIIDNVGSSTVKVTHQDSGSTSGNRIITASTNGQIIGAGGRMIGVYDLASSRWRVSVVVPGAPIPVAFAAGNFTASGSMTWTVASGDQYQFEYIQEGKYVTVFLSINTSTVGGTPSTVLAIAIPGGFTTVLGGAFVCRISDNGTGAASVCSINGSATGMNFFKDFTAAANWTASTDNTAIQGYFKFEVV